MKYNKHIECFSDQKCNKSYNEISFEQKYNNKRFKYFETEDKYELWISGEFPCMFYGFENDSPDMIYLIRDLRNSNKNKELHIFIDSYGGYTDSLLLLVNEILKFKHIVTVTTSVAQSCGAYLFLTGHERYVSKNSMICFHDVSINNIDGKIDEIKHYIEKATLQYKILDEQLGLNKFLTEEELEKQKTTEVYLTGEDIISRNLAIDYSYYLDRKLPKKIEWFNVNNFIAIKGNNEKYALIDKNQYENIIKNLNYDLSFTDIIKINNNLVSPVLINDVKKNKKPNKKSIK